MDLPRHDVVILTAGLTGSSLVAGWLKEIGYWTGVETMRKPDYDTFENRELVVLNERLLNAADYRERFDRVFRRKDIGQVVERLTDIDLAPYRQFIEECDRHRPWLWKDPRLWLTIRFWAKLFGDELNHLRIILLDRRQSQAWTSHLLRRQIQSPSYLRAYMGGILASLLEFVNDYQLTYLKITYEDFLLSPEATIHRLGDFLETEITMAAFHRVYHGQLYRQRHGFVDHLHAVLIYLKNYGSRQRLSDV